MALASGLRGDALRALLLGLLILALGLVLAQWPLLWATALVSGSIGCLLLLLHPTWGLIPLLLTVPLARLGGLTAAGMRISPAEMMLVGVLLAWMIQMAAQRQIRFPHPPLLLPFLLFLGAMLASMPGALSLGAGAKELIKWGSMLGVYLFVAARVQRRHLGLVVGAILTAGCGQAALGVYQFFTARGPEWFLLFDRFMRAYGTFEQPNPYGGYLGLTLPLAVALMFDICHLRFHRVWPGSGGSAPKDDVSGSYTRQRSSFDLKARIGRLAALGALLLMLVALAMSWSRGAWLGFGAAMLTMIAAHGRRMARLRLRQTSVSSVEASSAEPSPKSAILTGAAMGVLILALLLSSARLLPPTLAQRFAGLSVYLTVGDVTTTEVTEANYAVIERLAHWQAALRMWADHPWRGVGIGNYPVVYPSYGLPHWPQPLGHAHNYYLNIGAEAGLVGLLFYLIFSISALWQAFRATQMTTGLRRAVALGALGALVHLTVHSLFDNLYVHTMYLQIAVLLGLLAVISPHHPPKGGKSGEGAGFSINRLKGSLV